MRLYPRKTSSSFFLCSWIMFSPKTAKRCAASSSVNPSGDVCSRWNTVSMSISFKYNNYATILQANYFDLDVVPRRADGVREHFVGIGNRLGLGFFPLLFLSRLQSQPGVRFMVSCSHTHYFPLLWRLGWLSWLRLFLGLCHRLRLLFLLQRLHFNDSVVVVGSHR